MGTEEILSEFYDEDIFTLEKDTVKLALIPERLRGETLPVDLKVKSKVYVEAVSYTHLTLPTILLV